MDDQRRRIREHELDAVMRKLEEHGDGYQRDAFAEMREENARLRAAAEASRQLLAALPRCNDCAKPAVHNEVAGSSEMYCDEHRPFEYECDYAQPLRDTVAALDALDKDGG
jgi:hypothetical protein